MALRIGNDRANDLNGTSQDDRIFGLGGDDTIEGRNGSDRLFGNNGDDTISGGNGADSLFGGNGTDVLDGGNGPDRLDGGNGGDILSGGNGADALIGGNGNDMLTGGAGADVLLGGNGTDTADYSDQTTRVVADLDAGTAGLDTVDGIENLIGGSRGDRLVGDEGDNRIEGRGGNDVLIGGGGDDTLIGGAGRDTVDYSSEGAVRVNLGSGQASDDGTGGSDRLQGIENVVGSLHDDRIVGDDGNNRLQGQFGADTLTGGGGADEFTYDSRQEFGDTIRDFASGDDRLVISINETFPESRPAAGTLDDSHFSSDGTANDGNDWFILDGNRLFFDADGTGSLDRILVARFTADTPDSGDIQLV
ncbi:MAG: M10 family metallopeptidase C-terminal domain-containing protein [Magnetospirillum sp.]|nr:M10 family metallopeptidase C-terminal domain-containing protein [Magnetospirillum sp.]